MRTTILAIIILFIGASIFAASPYESAMQKGIDMLAQANSSQAAIDVTNYFERVAEANKNEWLPLYYAAYSSLSAGYQQEKSAMKDEWYKKGLDFIERAKAIKENESELLAMEGYLKLMYISNDPMTRAPQQTGDAIALLEKAKALNPANPRPWFIHGQNTFYTPEFFGGGPKNAKPLLEKASGLYKSFTPENSLMPKWGTERCEKLLAQCNDEKK